MRTLFAAASALLSIALLLAPANASRAQPARADAARDQYDFGSVKQGTHIDHEFAIRNDSNAALRLSAAELSMPGMKAR
ncbi:MAG TPA: hypothetical protein VHQ21_11985, partial [Rhodanobacteraceae bacterium]|nr:hypothetical protein [Rhodanobacteraceae bacterium]